MDGLEVKVSRSMMSLVLADLGAAGMNCSAAVFTARISMNHYSITLGEYHHSVSEQVSSG